MCLCIIIALYGVNKSKSGFLYLFVVNDKYPNYYHDVIGYHFVAIVCYMLLDNSNCVTSLKKSDFRK